MQSVHPELGDQAFANAADALVTVQYQSHRDALKFVQSVLSSARGVGVLYGSRLSGKTTIVRRVKNTMPDGTAIALIDGTDIRPGRFLTEMLDQYGYNTGLQSTAELLQMVEVFATQQTQSTQSPILIIDNVEHMYPSALRTLNSLASLTVQHRFAIRILLTGKKGLSSLVASADMVNIARRQIGIFVIGPMSARETLLYLHAQLTARGVQQPYEMFPADMCNRLHELSGGWPGVINHYAKEAIRPERPRLILSRNGTTVSHYTFSTRKIMIGRSEFADVVLDDQFASKLHAVLMLYSNALVLLDLNSSNGTTVNSVRTISTILQDNDIISIGNHRLKVANAPTLSAEIAERISAPDTVRTKTLAEMRRLREELRLATDEEKQRG